MPHRLVFRYGGEHLEYIAQINLATHLRYYGKNIKLKRENV